MAAERAIYAALMKKLEVSAAAIVGARSPEMRWKRQGILR
jgi:hypothetical protein